MKKLNIKNDHKINHNGLSESSFPKSEYRPEIIHNVPKEKSWFSVMIKPFIVFFLISLIGLVVYFGMNYATINEISDASSSSDHSTKTPTVLNSPSGSNNPDGEITVSPTSYPSQSPEMLHQSPFPSVSPTFNPTVSPVET